MNKIKLQSPAKVNLWLKITGRRADGYHLLDTLFHRISLADTLSLSKKPSGFSFSSNAKLPPREGNLLFKAYCELQKKFPDLPGVYAHLQKRIPIGAGLGGGSSNAAFFLLGMKKLYRLKISKRELMRVGVRVGADVPFFLLEESEARATGIGEKLSPRKVKHKHHFLLICDPRPLATISVYKKYAALQAKNQNLPNPVVGLKRLDLINDLQIPAIRLRPSIGKVLRKLAGSGHPGVLMSGSGPTVFAVSHSETELKRLRKTLPVALQKQSRICRTF